jgi:serine protease Do
MLETEFWRMTAMSVDRSNGKFFLALLGGVALTACSPSASTAVPPVFAAAPPTAAPPATAAPVAPLVTGLPDFTGLVERYGPAVVNVKVNQKARSSRARNNAPQAPESANPLEEFLRQWGGGNLPRGAVPQQPRPSAGEGSGFVVSADGYIITNAHVVRDANDITVKLTDRREYPAKLIGLDDRTDVAVIKIEGKELPTVRIGDPSKLKPGQWVVAIGSPFGMENSVTAGIVSATFRQLPDEQYQAFIQTDVAVNPGNSGGPLFNLNGEVVGINSQIYSQSGGYMGLSFAIPIDVANDVREQLVKTGRVTRGMIGVSIQPMDADIAESWGLDHPHGALVESVQPGGPADKAGLKSGDVILSVDGKPVDNDISLPALISSIRPGNSTELEVWTDRKMRKVTAKVIEFKQGEAAEPEATGSGSNRGPAPKAEPAALGLSVRPLSPAERQDAGTQGSLVVEGVEGAAEEAGIRPGDVIINVAGAPVRTAAELSAAIKRQTGRVVALKIQRGPREVYLAIPRQ